MSAARAAAATYDRSIEDLGNIIELGHVNVRIPDQKLATLFYSFQGSRLAHFVGMVLIVGFLVVHVALALLVPKTVGAMITGGPVVDNDAP